MMSVPLLTLFTRSLSHASKAFNQPTIQDSTQDLIRSSLADLNILHSRISSFSLFSPNETLEDISTRDLVYLIVPYVIAEVQGRVKTTTAERMVSLDQSQRHFHSFLSHLGDYEIVPESERDLQQRKASQIANPAQRRELKIKQYQKEKDLRTRIEVIRKRRGQLAIESSNTLSDFDLISSLLPSVSQSKDEDEELESETDDVLREATLLLLRLFYAQAHSQLESIGQEMELLRNAPSSPTYSSQPDDDDQRNKTRKNENDIWKLDTPSISDRLNGDGPLLDHSGKPLRPFTILSDAANRSRMQAQVFGPGHRLPTMSIDEYLQIERERGNIISGGGAASQAAPTSSEQLALDAEMDGSRAGEEKEEIKRLKDENWAGYTDDNPKGGGNTMNRG